jgi:hypothetical protein
VDWGAEDFCRALRFALVFDDDARQACAVIPRRAVGQPGAWLGEVTIEGLEEHLARANVEDRNIQQRIGQ